MVAARGCFTLSRGGGGVRLFWHWPLSNPQGGGALRVPHQNLPTGPVQSYRVPIHDLLYGTQPPEGFGSEHALRVLVSQTSEKIE